MKSTIMIALSLFVIAACTEKATQSEKKNLGKYKFVQKHAAHKHGKARRLMANEIHQLKSTDDRLILEASVTPTKDMENCRGQWQLPEGAITHSGDVEISTSLAAHQTKKFRIELAKDSLKTGDKIFFVSYQMKNGERHGAPAMFVVGQPPANEMVQKSSTDKFKNKKIFQ